MKITWLGHSAFLIEGDGKRVLVDPFLSGNPHAPVKPEEIECDVIAVTHGHGDHLGDAEAIAKRCGAPVVAIYEIATYLGNRGVETVGMNFGGTARVKGVSLTMVHAVHSSGILAGENFVPGGHAAGFVIEVGGKRVYHAGDTDIFGDMNLIGELHRPHVALLPIGGLFTMDPRAAAYAATKLIKPEVFVPMHYGTWPPIDVDPESIRSEIEGAGIKYAVLKPGETLEL